MSKANVKVRTENVSPAMARKLLETNTLNRNLRPAVVAKLAGAMQRGEWELNGETIKVGDHGALIDGQHRLAAVVAGGVTVPMLVVRGLPAKTQGSVDTGMARTVADALRLRGEHRVMELAAGLRGLWKMQTHGSLQERFLAPTVQELMVVLDENPEIRGSAAIVGRTRTYTRIPPGNFITLHYLFSRVDKAAALTFFQDLGEGEGLLPTDPVHVLRNQILRARQGPKRHTSVMLAAWAIKAWNARRLGDQHAQLHWKTAYEPFPMIEGLDMDPEMSDFSETKDAVVEMVAELSA